MSSPALCAITLLTCAFTFTAAQTSCRGRCGAEYYRGHKCQCDYECLVHDECCKDYESQCTTRDSCKGRCGEIFKRGRLCSCDSACMKYQQCCPDYKTSCDAAEPTLNGPTEQPYVPTPTFNEGDIPDVYGQIFPTFPDDPYPENGVEDPEATPIPESGFEPSPADLLEPVPTTDPTLPDIQDNLELEFTPAETFTHLLQTQATLSDNKPTQANANTSPSDQTNKEAQMYRADASDPKKPDPTSSSDSGTTLPLPSTTSTAVSHDSRQPTPNSVPQNLSTPTDDTPELQSGGQAEIQPEGSVAVLDESFPEVQSIDPTEASSEQPEVLPSVPEKADTLDSNQASNPTTEPVSDTANDPQSTGPSQGSLFPEHPEPSPASSFTTTSSSSKQVQTPIPGATIPISEPDGTKNDSVFVPTLMSSSTSDPQDPNTGDIQAPVSEQGSETDPESGSIGDIPDSWTGPGPHAATTHAPFTTTSISSKPDQTSIPEANITNSELEETNNDSQGVTTITSSSLSDLQDLSTSDFQAPGSEHGTEPVPKLGIIGDVPDSWTGSGPHAVTTHAPFTTTSISSKPDQTSIPEANITNSELDEPKNGSQGVATITSSSLSDPQDPSASDFQAPDSEHGSESVPESGAIGDIPDNRTGPGPHAVTTHAPVTATSTLSKADQTSIPEATIPNSGLAETKNDSRDVPSIISSSLSDLQDPSTSDFQASGSEHGTEPVPKLGIIGDIPDSWTGPGPHAVTTHALVTATSASSKLDQTSIPEANITNSELNGTKSDTHDVPTITSSPPSDLQDPSTRDFHVPGSEAGAIGDIPDSWNGPGLQSDVVNTTAPSPTDLTQHEKVDGVTPAETTTGPLKVTVAPSKPIPSEPTSKPQAKSKPSPSKLRLAKPTSIPTPKLLDTTQTLNIDNPRDYQADDSNDTNLCSGRPVSAVTTLGNGTMVVFRGHYFWVLDKNRVPGPARGITAVWGVPSPIETVFTRCNCYGKTYIFKGGQYWRFKNDVVDPGYPKLIQTGFDGLQGHITAALSVPQYQGRRESVYFFKRGGSVQKYTYQFGTSPTCGRKVKYIVYTVRHRLARQAVSVLEPAINHRAAWTGFPSSVTSAVSVVSRQEPEGYKYYVFSRSKYYNVRMDGERPVLVSPQANAKPQRNSANDFFKCPKKV